LTDVVAGAVLAEIESRRYVRERRGSHGRHDKIHLRRSRLCTGANGDELIARRRDVGGSRAHRHSRDVKVGRDVFIDVNAVLIGSVAVGQGM